MRAVLRLTAPALWLACLAVPAAGGADPAERASDVSTRENVNLTIYNGTLALVHDQRRVPLDDGLNRIAWRDVSSAMDPTSAIVEDVTAPGAVSVLEQNFDFDVLTPQAMLDKYVGHEVTVVHPKATPGHPQRETAKLLSDQNGVVLQYADRIETSLDGTIDYPSVPANLRDRPTLVLDLQSSAAAAHDLDLSYITGGLSWSADYVGIVSPDESHVDLHGLVTLSNKSGATFENAHLQLVAGNVNAPPPPQNQMLVYARAASSAFQPQFNQENYFEYHLYTLQRTTTIANNQTKQVALLSARDVPIHKTLELRGGENYYSSREPDLGAKLPVGVYETFMNKGGDLGIPLPGGIVRLYKNDSAGTSQFLGADTIGHTPRNEDVRLHLGDSFDVTAHKKQTDFQLPGNCTDLSSYEIELKNAKTDPVTVLVIEPIPGDWQITAENLPHEKSSSSTATWSVNVPADGSATLTYTARVKFCL